MLKLCFVFFMFAMVKAFVPRYRYDQLMRLGWKVFLPLSLVMVVVTAAFLNFTVDGAMFGGLDGRIGGFWSSASSDLRPVAPSRRRASIGPRPRRVLSYHRPQPVRTAADLSVWLRGPDRLRRY